MMKYELFKEVVADRIMEYMPPIFSDFNPEIESVPKVNGNRDALALVPQEDSGDIALPLVYLDDMYEIFSANEDMDDILEFISGVFIGYTGTIRGKDLDLDFESKKDSIILNLINTEINSDLLKDIPHMDILNMSVIFRVIMRWEGDGFDSIIINRHIMEEMGMDEDKLYALALKNSRRLFPPVIKHLSDDMYMVSNKGFTFGASVIVYEDFMKEVGKTIGDKNFYLLPTSIHELLAFPSDYDKPEKLVRILAEGNSEITKKKDILSNALYAYDSSEGCIRTAACYC